MATLLIIGSNSFGGASYIKYALQAGHKVIACSRSDLPNSLFLPYQWDSNSSQDVQFHRIDLNQDIDALKQLIDKNKPRYILNFASQSMVAQSWDHPQHWMQTNVVATTSLMEILRGCDFLDLYLHFSTPEVYGNTEGWITESENYSPSTPYALSRAAGDMVASLWRKTYDIPVVITRAANIYGEGQQLYRIIPKTILSILGHTRFQLHGGGLSERAFIHMEDVSSAIELILAGGSAGDTYHISPHETISIKDLVQLICKKLDTTLDEVADTAEDRRGKDNAYLLNSDLLRQRFSFSERVSLDAGLSRCIEWATTHYDELIAQPQSYLHKI